jgi:hypothetical protein
MDGMSGMTGMMGLQDRNKLRMPLGRSPEWQLWYFACVRGAGFPVDWALRLASPQLAAKADAVALQARHELTAREACTAVLRAQIDAAPPRSALRTRLAGALRAVLQGQAADSAADMGAMCAAPVTAHAASVAALTQARTDYHAAYAERAPDVTARLQALASDPRFQEAVIWQNRLAYHSGVRPLLRHRPRADRRNAQFRQHEQMAASYVQRYALKNDSIGFFGPIGWGRFSAAPFHLRHRPDAAMLKTRQVYWEGWAVDALAASLSRLPGMRPWIAPRLSPYADLADGMLSLPGRQPMPLDAPVLAVLRRCDGTITVQAMAQQLSVVGMTLEQVVAVCTQCEAQGLLEWRLRAPLEPHAQDYLRAQLERIGVPALRATALGQLERMEQARGAVAVAHGDPVRLDHALAALDALFAELTGEATMRGAGRNYAGRTLVYEDCQRGLQLEVGQALLDRLAPPLELLLASGNWVMAQLGALYRDVFETLLATLRAQGGADTVDIAVFWQQAQPLLMGPQSRAGAVLRRFQQRWADILQVDGMQKVVHLRSGELRERVLQAFGGAEPAWQSARYQCPDIMIAAADLAAVERGDYQLVMGEMHLAHNTQVAALFVEQHPDPASIAELLDTDIPAPRLQAVPPPGWEGYTTRTSVGAMADKDYRLIMSENIASTPAPRQLRIGELVADTSVSPAQARTRDGRIRFDLLEACAEALNDVAVDFLKLLPDQPHQPRVVIDDVVVARECWSVAPQQLPFAQLKNEAARFLAARGWAREHGLPRLVFVKTPVEGKPFFVDFDSPVYTDILCKAIRRSAEAGADALRFSEMYPLPEQTWLTDAEGNRYTCELRCVVVRQDGCTDAG